MTKDKNLMWLYMAICRAQIRFADDERASALLEKVETKALSVMMEPTKTFDEMEMCIIKRYVY